jgi:hypothetical protein
MYSKEHKMVLDQVLLDRGYIGKLISPFKFTYSSLVHRSYYLTTIDEKDQFDYDFIKENMAILYPSL